MSAGPQIRELPDRVDDLFPPFHRLLTADFHGLLNQAFLVALLVGLVGLLGLARAWVRGTFAAMEQELEITAVLPDGAPSEAFEVLRSALEARSEVIGLAEFGAETARDRLEAAGIDVESLDPFALQHQPGGFTFRWEGLVADPDTFREVSEQLAEHQGATFHWDERRALRRHSESMRADAYMRGLCGWSALAALAGLLVAAMIRRAPDLGVPLRRGEMAQALFVRGGVAATLGWMIAGALLKLASGWPPLVDWAGLWIGLLWIVPAAALFAPLGVMRAWGKLDP